ncbi:MAG: LegC family aminotransferase [Bacteroidales bacterium]|nr:LegC family aminotransferase [Bacteroidales bacterium]
MYKEIIKFIQDLYNTKDLIPLHEPRFIGNEKKYLNDCINSTFVSSVGKYVDKFEKKVADYTGAKYAVATVNGTAALHVALILAGVKNDDEVITQALTFISTANAISYTGAKPVFIDVDKDTMGLSSRKLQKFLETYTYQGGDHTGNYTYNLITKKRIRACVPMHTFGFPCRIDEIKEICDKFNINLIEDAAESLGSFYKGKHTGTFGKFGVLSFNGNKIITTGGGGMIITNDKELAQRAKHITTQAKTPHKWEYVHDYVGYNYRLPNINSALGVAQLEKLDFFITNKRELAELYKKFFNKMNYKFLTEPKNSKSNYWLNVLIFKDKTEKDCFLKYTNENGIMTRPIWKLMVEMKMYKVCQKDDLTNSKWLYNRVVNIPSSVRL